jgi:hypothetical protein
MRMCRYMIQCANVEVIPDVDIPGGEGLEEGKSSPVPISPTQKKRPGTVSLSQPTKKKKKKRTKRGRLVATGSTGDGGEDEVELNVESIPEYAELTGVCASYDEYAALALPSIDDVQPFVDDQSGVVLVQEGVALWGQATNVRMHPSDGLEIMFEPSPRCKRLVSTIRTRVGVQQFGWSSESRWYGLGQFDMFDWMEFGNEF